MWASLCSVQRWLSQDTIIYRALNDPDERKTRFITSLNKISYYSSNMQCALVTSHKSTLLLVYEHAFSKDRNMITDVLMHHNTMVVASKNIDVHVNQLIINFALGAITESVYIDKCMQPPSNGVGPDTVKPVYNDHLNGYFSAFCSSSRRQIWLARVNWYLQSSLKHITK